MKTKIFYTAIWVVAFFALALSLFTPESNVVGYASVSVPELFDVGDSDGGDEIVEVNEGGLDCNGFGDYCSGDLDCCFGLSCVGYPSKCKECQYNIDCGFNDEVCINGQCSGGGPRGPCLKKFCGICYQREDYDEEDY